jgi:hypothetical protein
MTTHLSENFISLRFLTDNMLWIAQSWRNPSTNLGKFFSSQSALLGSCLPGNFRLDGFKLNLLREHHPKPKLENLLLLAISRVG